MHQGGVQVQAHGQGTGRPGTWGACGRVAGCRDRARKIGRDKAREAYGNPGLGMFRFSAALSLDSRTAAMRTAMPGVYLAPAAGGSFRDFFRATRYSSTSVSIAASPQSSSRLFTSPGAITAPPFEAVASFLTISPG